MPNTSATGGYLVGTVNPTVLYTDNALQDFLHEWIVGITGLAPALVRPRWQPEQPNIPQSAVDWCAFGITDKSYIGQPFVNHIASSIAYPNGYDEVRSHQELTVMVTFYGPDAENYELLLSKGMFVAQNQEALNLVNVALTGCGGSTTIPELIKEKWVYRVDLPIYFRRQIVLDYQVLNLLHGQLGINNEYYTENITAG
ncbi:MAG: hypothetical protein JRZ94_05350 [Nitrososphaerota archaeon]|nr:hypothetical protein [Nitrososphaerota archaeon]